MDSVTQYQLYQLKIALTPLLYPPKRGMGWGLLFKTDRLEKWLFSKIAQLANISVIEIDGENPYSWGRALWKKPISHLFTGWEECKQMVANSKLNPHFFTKLNYIGVVGEPNWQIVEQFRCQFLTQLYPMGTGKGGLVWAISLPEVVMEDFLVQPGWRWGSYGMVIPGVGIKPLQKGIECWGAGIDPTPNHSGRLYLPVKISEEFFLYPLDG